MELFQLIIYNIYQSKLHSLHTINESDQLSGIKTKPGSNEAKVTQRIVNRRSYLPVRDVPSICPSLSALPWNLKHKS